MTKTIALAFMTLLAFQTPVLACEDHQHGGGHDHGGHTPTPQKPVDQKCSIEFKSLMTCAQVQFAKAPNSNEDSAFTLKLESHHALDIKKVSVELWMDMGHGHGHGSAPVTIEQLDAATFKVSNVWFVMMGQWQIKVKIETQNGEETGILPVVIQ